jgi:hypothetical protein
VCSSDLEVALGIAGRTSTEIELGAALEIQTIIAVEPPPATVVMPGSRLVLRPAAAFGVITSVDWYRDSALIASNQPELVIESATSGHSGRYWATFSGHPEFSATTPQMLLVAHTDRHRLVNQSTRLTISADSPTATFGFVIGPRAANSYYGQRVLIRVVGPDLADFGVGSPLSDPVYTLHHADGDDITPGIYFAEVIYEDGSTPQSRYLEAVAEQSRIVGAFPIDAQLQYPVGSRSVADAPNLAAGAYTLTVSSASGGTGEVLVEIYEVHTAGFAYPIYP